MAGSSDLDSILERAIPEAADVIKEVNEKQKAQPNFGSSDYGHALTNIAFVAGLNAETKKDPEFQRRALRQTALDSLKLLGIRFLPQMPEKLRSVITDEDIEALHLKR
ncbi:MAG: hypothetical protein Q7S31_03435 [bacterium]|nr:hypothetical protein [bacterium]